jgi:hypothetical protein
MGYPVKSLAGRVARFIFGSGLKETPAGTGRILRLAKAARRGALASCCGARRCREGYAAGLTVLRHRSGELT